MKILAVADRVTSFLLEPVPDTAALADIDLIVSCGDLPPEFLARLKARYDVPLFYVLGNHDLRYNSSPPQGCRCIDRRLVTHRGLRILGFSGSRWYNGNVNQFTETEMAASIRRLRLSLWLSRGVDLVVTHAPPRHIHDAEDRCHRGFASFNTLIARYRPACLVHGHIHSLFAAEAARVTTVNTTRVINSYGYCTFEI
ncbi:MAG TPA: metallophosphoesterase [Desulfoprunum sp.]|nr:metallophosphoesterase [Desulfoprunum sp.]